MNATAPLTVALVQMACSADRAENQRHIHEQLRAAAAQGAQLVLLQELHDTLYFCQTENTDHFDLAETIPGPATDALATLARELQLVIVASLFERPAGQFAVAGRRRGDDHGVGFEGRLDRAESSNAVLGGDAVQLLAVAVERADEADSWHLVEDACVMAAEVTGSDHRGAQGTGDFSVAHGTKDSGFADEEYNADLGGSSWICRSS